MRALSPVLLPAVFGDHFVITNHGEFPGDAKIQVVIFSAHETRIKASYGSENIAAEHCRRRCVDTVVEEQLPKRILFDVDKWGCPDCCTIAGNLLVATEHECAVSAIAQVSKAKRQRVRQKPIIAIKKNQPPPVTLPDRLLSST